MDREKAAAAFNDYVSAYDPENPMIFHKKAHTYRVAGAAARIAGSLEGPEWGIRTEAFNEEERRNFIDFAWFLGLLHDIGRFEQVRRYGTFLDAVSVDHAELGADLLFRENLMDRFPDEGLMEGWRNIAETAIRLHNKLTLPGNLDQRTRTFATVLRDADKCDIFRVVCDMPLEQRMGTSKGMITEGEYLSPEVLRCVKEHRCVPRGKRQTKLDGLVSHCCMAFELEYPESRRIAREQGYLLRMLKEGDGAGRPALASVRLEIERAWGMPLAFDQMIAVTNRHMFDGEADPEGAFIRQLLLLGRLGLRAVVLREKDLPEEEYRALAGRILTAADREAAEQRSGAAGLRGCLVFHGHPETARALDINRVHLPLAELRRLQEENPAALKGFEEIGTSVHSVPDALAAVNCGAAYCFAGNVYETTCKPGLEAKGLRYLREIVSAVRIPVYGIGGVSFARMPEILETGAAGGCMMSGFMTYAAPQPEGPRHLPADL